MCGRYTLRKGLSEVAAGVGSYLIEPASGAEPACEPRFNIAPTQHNLVLRKAPQASQTLETTQMRWGLIPSWSKRGQSQSPMINARSETVAEKPAFRAAFQRRRCLVPADGFYEWKQRRGASIPFFFSLSDDSVFFMAGIWETWIGEHGEQIDSYTVLTTHANALLAKFHERMPVILGAEQLSLWLESDMSRLPLAERNELLAPIDPGRMRCQPANPLVNNNRSEGPACLEAPETHPASQLDLGL